ncbi:MAG: ABC transporter substrate-binding protein [bacterium]
MRCLALVALVPLGGCGGERSGGPPAPETLFLPFGRVKTLDPALAEDVISGQAVGHLYDRLLQYDATARPYRLVPAMAETMPERRDDGRVWRFHLRDDARFAADPGCDVAASRTVRRVTSRDVIFSLLRLADARLHSPGYWTLRDRVVGLAEFRARTERQAADDWSAYDTGVPGLVAVDARTVEIRLTAPYPQLLNVLAMPYASIVSERAVRQYGQAALAERPLAVSGPFLLTDWRRNYRFELRRNPEYWGRAARPGSLALPRLDRVVGLVIQEPQTAWLLFLQGNLDLVPLGEETLEAVVTESGQLVPELAGRGIQLEAAPEFQINYLGFNLGDPVLGNNPKLRQALTLAFDRGLRLRLARRQLLPAYGPIPPGVAGYDPAFRGPFGEPDLTRARRLLAEAGYPDGRDPATGTPLRLRFDLGGTDLVRRRQAELLAQDYRRLGIEIEPTLNNWPRFLTKLRQGEVQLFRMAWVGDYPDAQNFLQLFYGPNTGGANRTAYRNPAFDRLYEAASRLPDGPERTDLYVRMQALVTAEVPCIFESFPVGYRLIQPWVTGGLVNAFAWDAWKYIAVDDAARRLAKRRAKPLAIHLQTGP